MNTTEDELQKSAPSFEDETQSQKSEGDIPYVTFEDFTETVNGYYDKAQWTYEWNRLVLDKA